MKRIISFYVGTTKNIGLIVFAYCGNITSNLIGINYLYKIRNVVSYGLIGYYVGPFILPIYFLQSLLVNIFTNNS